MPWLRVNIEFGGEMPCCDELGCGARRRNKSHRGSCFPIRLGFGDDDDGTATPFSSIRFAWNAREEVSPQPLKKRSSSSLLVAPSVPWDDDDDNTIVDEPRAPVIGVPIAAVAAVAAEPPSTPVARRVTFVAIDPGPSGEAEPAPPPPPPVTPPRPSRVRVKGDDEETGELALLERRRLEASIETKPDPEPEVEWWVPIVDRLRVQPYYGEEEEELTTPKRSRRKQPPAEASEGDNNAEAGPSTSETEWVETPVVSPRKGEPPLSPRTRKVKAALTAVDERARALRAEAAESTEPDIARGLLEEALELLNESIEAKKALLGDEHLSTLTAVYRYCAVLLEAGRAREARPLLKQALDRISFYARRGQEELLLLEEGMENLLVACGDQCELQKELAEPIWKPGQARPSWNASPQRRDREYEEKVGWNEPPVIEQKQRLMQARILKAWMK